MLHSLVLCCSYFSCLVQLNSLSWVPTSLLMLLCLSSPRENTFYQVLKKLYLVLEAKKKFFKWSSHIKIVLSHPFKQHLLFLRSISLPIVYRGPRVILFSEDCVQQYKKNNGHDTVCKMYILHIKYMSTIRRVWTLWKISNNTTLCCRRTEIASFDNSSHNDLN